MSRLSKSNLFSKSQHQKSLSDYFKSGSDEKPRSTEQCTVGQQTSQYIKSSLTSSSSLKKPVATVLPQTAFAPSCSSRVAVTAGKAFPTAVHTHGSLSGDFKVMSANDLVVISSDSDDETCSVFGKRKRIQEPGDASDELGSSYKKRQCVSLGLEMSTSPVLKSTSTSNTSTTSASCGSKTFSFKANPASQERNAKTCDNGAEQRSSGDSPADHCSGRSSISFSVTGHDVEDNVSACNNRSALSDNKPPNTRIVVPAAGIVGFEPSDMKTSDLPNHLTSILKSAEESTRNTEPPMDLKILDKPLESGPLKLEINSERVRLEDFICGYPDEDIWSPPYDMENAFHDFPEDPFVEQSPSLSFVNPTSTQLNSNTGNPTNSSQPDNSAVNQVPQEPAQQQDVSDMASSLPAVTHKKPTAKFSFKRNLTFTSGIPSAESSGTVPVSANALCSPKPVKHSRLSLQSKPKLSPAALASHQKLPSSGRCDVSPKKSSKRVDIPPKKSMLNETSPKESMLNEVSPKKSMLNEVSPKKSMLNEISPKKPRLNEISPKKSPLKKLSNSANSSCKSTLRQNTTQNIEGCLLKTALVPTLVAKRSTSSPKSERASPMLCEEQELHTSERMSTDGLNIENILKHSVLRVLKMEPEDYGVLHSLQASLNDLVVQMFECVPLSVLKQHAPRYDAHYHEKLLLALNKIRQSKAQCEVQNNQQQNSSLNSSVPPGVSATSPSVSACTVFRKAEKPVMSTPSLPEPGKLATTNDIISQPSFRRASSSHVGYSEMWGSCTRDFDNDEGDEELDESVTLGSRLLRGPDNEINYTKVIYNASPVKPVAGAPASSRPSSSTNTVKRLTPIKASCSLSAGVAAVSPVRFRGNVRNDGPTGEFSGMNYPHTRQMLQVFQNCFGLRRFRENQKEIINAALLGKDCFVLMPTGGGKSLCYQLPACVNEGVSIVVSPLKSLIHDQVQKMASLDIAAAKLSGELSMTEENAVYTQLLKREPGFKLLYVTPEKISASQKFVGIMETLFKRQRLARFIIDEAHCVSQWGHDFRPDYKKLNMLRTKFPGVPFMALTATATPRVRIDILHQLSLTNPKWFLSSFNRSNLHYEVLPKKGKKISDEIAEFINSRFKDRCGIVYCLSRKECDTVAAELRRSRIAAMSYHAGLTDLQRTKAQDLWVKGKCNVVVATIAFGMGIDKPDVRFVVHYSLPKSIEGYYQESGRAGRDGEPAHCTLYYCYQDMHRLKKMIELDRENFEAKKTHHDNLYRMVAYCENRTDCRRSQILNYFGEIFDRSKCKTNGISSCDNCIGQDLYQNVDVTKEAKAVLQTVQNLCTGGRWGNNFTINHFVDIFKGSEAKKVIENGHQRQALHGMGKSWQRNDCERLMHRLVLLGYLSEELVITRDDIANSYLRLGSKALDFLADPNAKLEVEMRLSKMIGPVVVQEETPDAELQQLQAECYEALLAEVKTIAEEKNMNYTNVINMVALRAMSRDMPECEEEMRRIPHITEANYLKYGQRLLDVTQRFAANKLVLLSERNGEPDFLESDNDEGDSWLESVSAPEPTEGSSPYFQSPKRRGRGGFRGRRAWRGKKKRGGTKSGSFVFSQVGSFKVQAARQAAARRKNAVAVLNASRPKPALMQLPTPRRSFLPPPRVTQL